VAHAALATSVRALPELIAEAVEAKAVAAEEAES